MKNRFLILTLAATLLLGACGTTIPSEDIWGSEGGITMDENMNIELTSGYVINRYNTNDVMLMSLHEQGNYLILDEDGHIVYTAANIQAGYGLGDAAFRYGYTPNIVDGNLVVGENLRGYNLTNVGYQKLVDLITSREVDLGLDSTLKNESLDLWNSMQNSYINEQITVTIAEESAQVKNKEAIRFSSIYDDLGSNGIAVYKMIVPYNDIYEIKSNDVTGIKLYDAEYDLIAEVKDTLSVELYKDELVYLYLCGTANSFVNVTVTLKEHLSLNPYDVLEQESIDSFDVYGDPNVDPLKSQRLNVTKRTDSRALYINCNNPEALDTICLNKVLTKADCTNKDVFFTFEHNNKTTQTFYYGYRVTNTGNEDMFVTVKNLGHQVGGPGSWLGEDEWIKFYNLKFDSHYDKLTDSQKANFDAYVGFSNNYKSANQQPITYRVPAGKYIYVMGGTTKDAYQNINVFGSADQKVVPSETGCSNGAVLFSVRGSTCLGQFMTYRDNDARNINRSEYVTENKELGYMKNNGYGAQYVGYDTVHGVVDTALTFTFNDKTTKKFLPVSYDNPYYATSSRGPAFSKIPDLQTKSLSNVNGWVTHINPNGTQNAVGTDMTRYITTDYETGEPIIISPEYFDGRDNSPNDDTSDGTGTNANIGNWMVDYIDTFTLVNQGDHARTVTYRLAHSGVILAYIRGADGEVDTSLFEPKYCVKINSSSYGAAIVDPFKFSIKVPAHSVVRFSVDYNLLANSYGYITHNLDLGEIED